MVSYERKPRWFPLIARAASPQALLSFRYTVRIFLVVTRSNAGWHQRQVAAGVNPAAKATLVFWLSFRLRKPAANATPVIRNQTS
jgi:hypothetical protein